MPIFVAALIGGIISALGSLVGRVLVALAVSYVTFKGLDTGVAWVMTEVQSNVGKLPAVTIQLLGICQIDTAVSIWISAITARLLVSGIKDGAVSRMRVAK